MVWVVYANRILDLRVEPARSEYSLGEDVVLVGTLEVHDLWTCHWIVAPGEKIFIYSGDVQISSSNTGPDGVFRIPIKLPFTPGIYAYRAWYPGRDWGAARDPCLSDTIVVGVQEVPPPPPPPPPPPIPQDWLKYAMYAGIGLIAFAGILYMVSK